MPETLSPVLVEAVKEIRASFIPIEQYVLALKAHPDFARAPKEGENASEAIANIMLAYRHVEDARMRLGKVIQAMDGGVSVYDKPKA